MTQLDSQTAVLQQILKLADSPGYRLLLRDLEGFKEQLDTIVGLTQEDLPRRQGALQIIDYVQGYVDSAAMSLAEGPDDGTNHLED